MRELFTTNQVAELFGVKPARISKWKQKGIIQASCFVLGRPRYSLQDIKKVVTTKDPSKNKTTVNG